jgi:hypothetical protein
MQSCLSPHSASDAHERGNAFADGMDLAAGGAAAPGVATTVAFFGS